MTLAVRQESPPAGPLDVPELVQPLNPLEIGIGAYTDIVAIDAPAEAEAGQTVNIQVAVKNLHTTGIYIACTGRYNGHDFALNPEYATVYWGQTHTFTYSFPMLSKDVRIDIWSFYWADPDWYEDDHEYVIIKLKTVVGWQLLDSATVGVDVSAPPVVGWQLLDSATARVNVGAPPVVGWQLLATVTIGVTVGAPPVVGWQPLATITIGVTVGAPPVVGWLPLDSVTMGVTAGPLPENWELVEHYIDPWAYFWDTEVETATAQYTLPPEEFPWTDDIATKITESIKSDLLEQGSHLLEWEVYLDRAGPVWSRWLIKVTGTIPPGTSRQIGWVLPWPLIIKGGFIIAALVLIYFIVKLVTSSIYQRKGLSEEIKKKWSRETLMGIIIDQRPGEYEREELEGKSDQELRDITNQIYREDVPIDDGWPWYIWATIAGVGIAGSFVAVKAIGAFAPKKGPEKKKEAVE